MPDRSSGPGAARSFARKRAWTKRIGDAGERDAARLLSQMGCTVLLRDCRTPYGELDLVCLDGAVFVFVEVKTRFCRARRTDKRPEPWRELTDAQKRRNYRAAISFLHDLGDAAANRLYRFDLVEVLRGPFGPVAIRHHVGFMGRPSYSKNGIPGRVFRRRTNSATQSMHFPVE